MGAGDHRCEWREKAERLEADLAHAARAVDAAEKLIALQAEQLRAKDDALATMGTYKGVTGESHMDLTLTNRASIVLCTVRNGKWVFGEPKVTRTW